MYNMTINEIRSREFASRLADVYGEEAVDFEQQRFTALAEKFVRLFGESSELRFFSAPGRTEVGGNHTDHNNGKVLAAAINLDAVACAAKRSDNIINVDSEGHKLISIDCTDSEIKTDEVNRSPALVRGICARFRELGYKVGGFDSTVTSQVLSGSGLSSSAAFEVLIATVLNYLYNDGKISAVEIAKISQYSENVYFKKLCGLLDQTTCSVGGFVTIDFENTDAPVIDKIDFDLKNAGHSLCIIDTGGTHAKLGDQYDAIRLEMNSVAEFFGKKVLREITEEDVFANIAAIREKTGDRALERAIHFFNENRRVDRLLAALSKGDFEEFKSIITESGKSSYMYNQNCFTLADPKEQPVAFALCVVEELMRGKGAYRVHGGGFAGTIQVFVPDSEVKAFVSEIERIFGSNSCYILSIRSHGGCEI